MMLMPVNGCILPSTNKHQEEYGAAIPLCMELNKLHFRSFYCRESVYSFRPKSRLDPFE